MFNRKDGNTKKNKNKAGDISCFGSSSLWNEIF